MPNSIYYPNPATLGNAASSYVNTALGGYPGFANIQSNLAGTLAPDVKRNIYQAAAERGIGIGSYGSPNVDANLLRSIGLTSADLQARGQQELTSAIGALPRFDLGSQYVAPSEQAAINSQQSIAGASQAGANYRSQLQIDAQRAAQQSAQQAAMDAQARQQAQKAAQDQATLALLDQIRGRYSGGNLGGPSDALNTQYGWMMSSGGGPTSSNYSTSFQGWDTGEWPTDSASAGWANYSTSPQGWDTGEWPSGDTGFWDAAVPWDYSGGVTTTPPNSMGDLYNYNPQPADFTSPTFDPYYSDYFGG